MKVSQRGYGISIIHNCSAPFAYFYILRMRQRGHMRFEAIEITVNDSRAKLLS